ncbi:hypothetical protein CBS101457_001956 [Exobasidium rhododendri]|nr:hypothetical protein CBS101457_001956 [Exobasidium rhododendri]
MTSREVIQDWADGEAGFTFERGRMEKAVRDICLENPVKLHASKETSKPALKLVKDDVSFIVKELMVSKSKAEEALYAGEGDLTKALTSLMTPAA